MEELNIIIEPELEFSLKKCGDIVPYGITPEERAKLAGIEENANDYTHPETHPASILDVVDVVNGAANKFLNERGEMVAVATSSIGVTGSPLYASTANSDVAGYKSLVGTPQTLETEILLTAKSTDGIVWGAKYLSAPFTEAVTIPTTAYGFDYWRKVSAANGTSRKHLRVFLYRAGVETNIITPLASPDIDETEFTERQISYIFPELALLEGDRIGIQEGFSTTHANNITLTYIVGDGRGWFMRLPLPLKHENLTDKNSEVAFHHIDTTVTKEDLDEADKVALFDSVTGNVVLTPKSNLQESTQGMKLLADYTYNNNIVLPPVQSIDYATSTVTFTAPHGITVIPGFYAHVCSAYINDYTIKTNYKAVPSGLQLNSSLRIVEIISPTVLRFSNVIAGTTYELPNTNPADVDFSMWHFGYIPAVDTDIIIENSVAVKAVVMARSQHGQPYLSAIGNETSRESSPDFGTTLGLGTAYWERDFFIAGNGLLVSRTFGTGNTIRSTGLAKVTYDTINTWRYEGITYINKLRFNSILTCYGNGTRVLVYKLA